MPHSFAVALSAARRISVVRFVGLNNLALAAHGRGVQFVHGFAQAVHHEPRRFVRDAKVAMNFVGAHAVLARVEHMRGHPPFSERNF